jgi:hypothetical protein
MGLVAATAGLFALGAYLGRDVSYGWGWAFFIAAFGVLLGMSFAAQRSEGLARPGGVARPGGTVHAVRNVGDGNAAVVEASSH